MQAQILGQFGSGPGFQVDGIAFTENAPNFWRISFPPLDQSDGPWARAPGRCAPSAKGTRFLPCMKSSIEFLAPISAFASGAKPAGAASHGSRFPTNPILPPDLGRLRWGNHRYARTRMKAMTCIQESGRDEEIVRFRTSLVAASACAVVAATRSIARSSSLFPTLGSVNFSVSGRIAWRKGPAEDNMHSARHTSGTQGHPSPLRYFSTSVSARDSASSNTATP